MPQAGIEPAIPECDRSQTHDLDRSGTGTYVSHKIRYGYYSANSNYGYKKKLIKSFTPQSALYHKLTTITFEWMPVSALITIGC